MNRDDGLRLALDRLLSGVPLAAVPELDAANTAAPDPVLVSLIAFSQYSGLDYVAALATAERAVEAAGTDLAADPVAVLLAWTMRGVASAGRRPLPRNAKDSWAATAPGQTPTGDPLRDVADRLGAPRTAQGDPDLVHFVRYLAAEAAVACNRFTLAAEIVEQTGPLPSFLTGVDGRSHPFWNLFIVMRSRVLAFGGHTSEAGELLVRALADRLELARPAPEDYLAVGCYVLVAWGLMAVGDVRRSARVALFAGPESLDRMSFVAQGLTLELLAAAAIAEGDVDAADAWRARAEPLAEHPITNSAVARLIARVELARGRASAAAEWADRSVGLARAEGRVTEAADGEAVSARARLALSESVAAVRRPHGAAETSADASTREARQLDALELRASGRRLRPEAGSDWAGLSARERDIALMVAEGLTNREIGRELHLSEHTVRAHVSRVLAAFGAASRFAVAARIAELFPAPRHDAPSQLTSRQIDVAELIAMGLGNAEIGRNLGLSVKTVEKHIGEVFRRWGVTSRVGIARIVRATSPTPFTQSEHTTDLSRTTAAQSR